MRQDYEAEVERTFIRLNSVPLTLNSAFVTPSFDNLKSLIRMAHPQLHLSVIQLTF